VIYSFQFPSIGVKEEEVEELDEKINWIGKIIDKGEYTCGQLTKI
jgi:hypothetical protein